MGLAKVGIEGHSPLKRGRRVLGAPTGVQEHPLQVVVLDPVGFELPRRGNAGRRFACAAHREQHLGPQRVNVRGPRIVPASWQTGQTLERGFEVARRRQPLRLRQGRGRLGGSRAFDLRSAFPCLLQRSVALERGFGPLSVASGGKRASEAIRHLGYLRRDFSRGT